MALVRISSAHGSQQHSPEAEDRRRRDGGAEVEHDQQQSRLGDDAGVAVGTSRVIATPVVRLTAKESESRAMIATASGGTSPARLQAGREPLTQSAPKSREGDRQRADRVAREVLEDHPLAPLDEVGRSGRNHR